MGARADSALDLPPLPDDRPRSEPAARAVETLQALVASLDPQHAAEDPVDVHRKLVVSALQRLVDPNDASTRAAPEARLDAMGRAYEALLETSLYRTRGTAICLKASGHWIEADAVLAHPARTRSKWLQREAKLPKSTVQRLAAPLARAATPADVVEALAAETARGGLAGPGELVVQRGLDRRRTGAHYTPRELTEVVVRRTLEPLLEPAPRSDEVISLRVCDPAMGAGAFLLETGRLLADRLLSAWEREGRDRNAEKLELLARRTVVERCLYGIDRDPLAVDLARLALGLFGAGPDEPPVRLDANLRLGNALVGVIRDFAAPRGSPPDAPAQTELDFGADPRHTVAGEPALDWPRAFPDVFAPARGGFDACVGNPPWVAYAGRAAQPLDPALRRYYEAHNAAFHGYRTLHGLFIRRSAELLRPGGRLGLVVPTSVADLSGYAPTRRAHDALCDIDAELMDFGDGAFEGVFQPCMALTSTRRSSDTRETDTADSTPAWVLERRDIGALEKALLDRLCALPPLPAELFGERGLQTTKDDLAQLRRLDAATPQFRVPLREGVDVGEFRAQPPSLFLDPDHLTARLRPPSAWQAVRALIRQTARYPIAALSDGYAFRNSVLAGFARDDWTEHALVAYLNSSVVRWFHYVRQRDARQGMPQLKIGHLRALPDVAVERDASLARLDALGKRLGVRNQGITVAERHDLDEAAFDALGLSAAERERVNAWMRDHPVPKPRRPGR